MRQRAFRLLVLLVATCLADVGLSQQQADGLPNRRSLLQGESSRTCLMQLHWLLTSHGDRDVLILKLLQGQRELSMWCDWPPQVITLMNVCYAQRPILDRCWRLHTCPLDLPSRQRWCPQRLTGWKRQGPGMHMHHMPMLLSQVGAPCQLAASQMCELSSDLLTFVCMSNPCIRAASLKASYMPVPCIAAAIYRAHTNANYIPLPMPRAGHVMFLGQHDSL